MNSDLLLEAKRRLPLPQLMAQLGHGDRAKKSARCMFHDDSSASFSIYQREDGSWAWKCHAGCGGGDEPAWLATLRGLSNGDACREYIKLAGVGKSTEPAPDTSRRIIATYDYTDEAGVLLFQVVRLEPKSFRQRRPDPDAPDGWTWKLDGTRRVLYRLPETLAAVQRGETIILAEGEKDVAALVDLGFAATCNAGGAGKWLDDYSATLRGAEVVIIADKDEAGRKHALLVARKLAGSAKCVRIVELPDFNSHPVKDAADYFAAGATADDFKLAISAASSMAAAPVALGVVQTGMPTDTEAGDEELPMAEFPITSLPPKMAMFVSAVAKQERVPVALPAIAALGVTSAALGSGLEVMSGPGRRTRGNLFLLGVAESGTGKSETFRIVQAPFLDYQSRVIQRWREQTLPRLRSEIAILDHEISALEKKAAKAGDASERERLRCELEERLARKDALALHSTAPCFVAQDVTCEKLATLLFENREVLFTASADARKVIDNVMGRYSSTKSTDEAVYLCTYSGDFVRVDRQSRDPIVLHRPCMTLCWLVQPDLAERMFDEESLVASGFLPRLLIANTKATPQKIEGDPPVISDAVRSRWSVLIDDLAVTFHAADKPVRIDPTPEAKRILDDYYNAVVERRQTDLTDCGSFASRYGEQAWRVGLVLHAALHGKEAGQHPLADETAANAVVIVQWFVEQQLSMLARTRRHTQERFEDEVLALMERRQTRAAKDHITARDVHNARIVPSAEAARALMAQLEHDGLLIGEDVVPERGGRPTRRYRQPKRSVRAA